MGQTRFFLALYGRGDPGVVSSISCALNDKNIPPMLALCPEEMVLNENPRVIRMPGLALHPGLNAVVLRCWSCGLASARCRTQRNSQTHNPLDLAIYPSADSSPHVP